MSSTLNFFALIVVSFFVSSIAQAQNAPVYSNYYNNLYLYNPAEAGIESYTMLHFNHRQQWVGFDGSPRVSTLSLQTPFDGSNAALGLKISTFSRGLLTTNDVLVTYGYHVPLNDNVKLRFGLSAGLISNGLDIDRVDAPDDPAVLNYLENNLQPTGNFGLKLETDGINFGLVMPQLFGQAFAYTESFEALGNISPFDNLMGMVYYRKKLKPKVSSRSRRKLSAKELDLGYAPLELYLLYHYSSFGNNQYEALAKLNLSKYFWVGGGFRQELGLTANTGLKYNGFTFSYAYEPSSEQVTGLINGSHELQIGIRFGDRKETKQEAEERKRKAAKLKAQREAKAKQAAAKREAAKQEQARKEEAARQEEARNEAARQEENRREAARQEENRREAARQEENRREAARQEEARNEAARQEEARNEAARQEEARKEAARQEEARKEAARQEEARKEAARQEENRSEAARQEENRREAARQEEARKEAARQEEARKEAARQEEARNEAARQEEARNEAARQEEARKEAARQEEARKEEERKAELAKIQESVAPLNEDDKKGKKRKKKTEIKSVLTPEDTTNTDHNARYNRTEEVAVSDLSKKQKKKRYLVYIRDYGDFSSADDFRVELIEQGLNGSVFFYNATKRFYVYIYETDKKSDAKTEAKNLGTVTQYRNVKVLTILEEED